MGQFFWSADDAKAGRCSFKVVGTVRRTALHYVAPRYVTGEGGMRQVWEKEDVDAGLCILSDVGTPRNFVEEDALPAPEELPAPTTATDPEEISWCPNITQYA